MLELNENEKIKAIVYKHWVFLLFQILKASAIAALIIFGLCYFGYCWENWLWGPTIFWTLILIEAVWVIRRWVIWRKDVVIITNQRVIDINQKSLFDKEVAEINYYKIRDIIYQIKGILASMFNFGRIELHLAGGAVLALDKIPHPQRIQKILLKSKDETELSAQELLDMISESKKKKSEPPEKANFESTLV